MLQVVDKNCKDASSSYVCLRGRGGGERVDASYLCLAMMRIGGVGQDGKHDICICYCRRQGLQG